MLSILVFHFNAEEDFSDSRGQINLEIPLREGTEYVFSRLAHLVSFYNPKR